MTQVVKIRKDGKDAEVVAQYVGDFIRDGWTKVEEFTDELGSQSTEDAERIAQEKSLRSAELQIKEAREDQERQEAGQAKIERDKEDLERKHQQDANNHSRGNIDHVKNIIDLKDKDEVKEYIKTQFNKDVDLRGSLEVVKEKAVLISRETV